MLPRAVCVPLLLSCALVAACGDKSAVSLSASIGNASVQVESLALGTRLGGGFDLSLDVGPEADGDSQVSLEAFALLLADQTLVSPLPVTPENATFPLTVPKGGRQQV